MGHFKLTVIILGGWILFDSAMNWRNALGVCITLIGVFVYTHFKMEDQANERRRAEAEATATSSKV